MWDCDGTPAEKEKKGRGPGPRGGNQSGYCNGESSIRAGCYCCSPQPQGLPEGMPRLLTPPHLPPVVAMGGEYPTPSSIRHTSNLPGVGLSVNSGPQSNLSNSHDDSVNIVNTSGGVGPLCGIDFGTRPVPIPQLGLTKFTPLGFHVPQAIKDKIWEGTFVDFSF